MWMFIFAMKEFIFGNFDIWYDCIKVIIICNKLAGRYFLIYLLYIALID